MLDEEVEFKLVRTRPLGQKEEFLSNLGSVLWGAGAFAMWSFANDWRTDIVPYGGIFVGCVTVGIYDLIKLPITDALQQEYETEQRILDEMADQQVTRADFEYRGQNLECVIRPDYENTGHVFRMSTNDCVIYPTFSYQPKQENPLVFSFRLYDSMLLEKFSAEKKAEINRQINPILDGGRTHISGPYENYRAMLIIALSRLIQGDDSYQLTIELDEDSTHVELSYVKNDYKRALCDFSRVASKSMDLAQEIERACFEGESEEASLEAILEEIYDNPEEFGGCWGKRKV